MIEKRHVSHKKKKNTNREIHSEQLSCVIEKSNDSTRIKPSYLATVTYDPKLLTIESWAVVQIDFLQSIDITLY